MRKTKIVCTIGPASESVEILKDLMESGMDVARLNFSHGDFAEHGARIKNIKQAAKEVNKSVAILLDTKGPEIRTGSFKNGEASIQEGNNRSEEHTSELQSRGQQTFHARRSSDLKGFNGVGNGCSTSELFSWRFCRTWG